MVAVDFRKVCVRYGSVAVLHEIDLQIAASRTTAIVGASGSGKSTLLQLVNGLIRPSSGSILVDGKPVPYADGAALVRLRRRIGWAVQGSGLFPNLRVRANIVLIARLQGWAADRIEARRARLFDLVGLDPALADRYPHELSGGQQQRVGLCRAMLLEPPLLLLDEPFSALDPITRADLHRHFDRLRTEEPVTVVLVTHDLAEAVRLADDLVVLQDGRVAQSGTVDAVRTHPADEHVRALFAGVVT